MTFVPWKLTVPFALCALCACGGGGVGGALGPATPAPEPVSSTPLQTIVGLGDSLTAGYQSGGMLGQTNVPLTQAQFTSIGLTAVPPTQENGWFSLFYSAAKGMTWVEQATPASSALPLIAGPGIGDQILPANPADTGGFPFATVPGRSDCDGFNVAAYSWASASSGAIRENPTSVTYDLGIPSLTLTEAIGMSQPLTTTCQELFNPPATATQAQIDALQSLVSGQSRTFYPVMERFSSPSNQHTPLEAAESLKPTLTTVWLGANDLLDYIFSGGAAPGVDTTAAQVQAHMTTILSGLRHAGSNVIVATLPNVVETPQFAVVANPASQALCDIQTYLACILFDFGITPFSSAEAEASLVQSSNAQLAGSSYLTESGVIYLLTEIDTSGPGAVAIPATGCGVTAGSCLGTYYLSASFAAQAQTVNTAINNGILAAAAAQNVPVVRIDQLFSGIYSGAGTYFDAAASINPGKCCTLAFGGGLLSFDGLHPSDTGYAFVAQAFVQAANSAFGTSIPAITPASAYAGAGGIYAPYPDPYACHTTCL